MGNTVGQNQNKSSSSNNQIFSLMSNDIAISVKRVRFERQFPSWMLSIVAASHTLMLNCYSYVHFRQLLCRTNFMHLLWCSCSPYRWPALIIIFWHGGLKSTFFFRKMLLKEIKVSINFQKVVLKSFFQLACPLGNFFLCPVDGVNWRVNNK